MDGKSDADKPDESAGAEKEDSPQNDATKADAEDLPTDSKTGSDSGKGASNKQETE